MFVRRGPAIVLSLALSAAALVGAPGALASDGGAAKDDVDRRGCEGASWTRLRAVAVEGNSERFEAIAAVFSNDDDIWVWKMRHNGDLSAQGEVRARDDNDRSFRVTRTMLNFPGADDVSFRAENQRTGEVCRVSVEY